ncbi:uncharacterized protein V6R79_016187 [Siganus canaliculatus]
MSFSLLVVLSPPKIQNVSRLKPTQLHHTMPSLKFNHWPLVLIHMLLLQIQPHRVRGVDHVSLKLRRLSEQFQQFQVLTQARLDMLALNQNRNSSEELWSRVQALSNNWNQISQDLDLLKQSTAQEIEGLREWSRKLEKKSRRLEGRLAVMERNMREHRRHYQKQKPDQDFSNLTLELQSQEERLAALQVQRDELLVGLKGLQDSLKNQAVRVNTLEGRLSDALQWKGGWKTRGMWGEERPLNPNIAAQEAHEPRRRSQTHNRGRTPGPRHGGINYSQASTHKSNPQPKPSKIHKLKPQPDSHPQMQVQYASPTPQTPDYEPQPGHQHPQSQLQVQAQTRPYSITQTVPEPHTQPEVLEQSGPKLYHQSRHLDNPSHLSRPLHLSQDPSSKDRENTTHLTAARPLASDTRYGPYAEPQQPQVSEWDGEKERDTKVESPVIHNLLQLPERQKIPARPVPKKDATICNVDSMLFFPSSSVDNYVTFSLTLPNLPELSVCLWLRVETSHIGTLLSYATEDNDNQLVLYGRDSSPSSSTFFASSATSLDFVIGDPAHRRLPMLSLLDGRWHHLCVVWSSIQGRFWHYSNRRLASSGSNFRKGWEIPGGGSVVMGQEQDSVGGGFDAAEGFAGQVAGFRMWNRVLSQPEVEGLAEGRGVPRGVVLGMEDIKGVHGEVQQVACECLEHCV